MSAAPRSIPRAVLAAVLLALASSCDSAVDPGTSGRVNLDTPVEGAISPSDTLRRHSLAAPEPATFIVLLKSFRGTVLFTISDSATESVLGYVTAGPTTLPLEDGSVGSFTTQAAGVVFIDATSIAPGGSAEYRFVVHELDRVPESRPAFFRLGDTVTGETLEPVGDEDEFTFTAQAGQEVVAITEAPGVAGRGPIEVHVFDPVTSVPLGYQQAPTGVAPAGTSGRVRFPAAGTYTFRFSSLVNFQQRFRGGYRFWTYGINPAPEQAPVQVPLGAEITGETIGVAGDVDEFTFSVAANTEVRAFFQAPPGMRLELAPPGGNAVAAVTQVFSDTSLFSQFTGNVVLNQAGTYVVRVFGQSSEVRADTGAYRFRVEPVNRAPESVPEGIAPGDTIMGESVDLPGDVDEFTFAAAAGQSFNVSFQARTTMLPVRLQLQVVDAGGAVIRTVLSSGFEPDLDRRISGRFTAATAGTIRLRVLGAPNGGSLGRGRYWVFLRQVDPAPESAQRTLAPGDSVLGEGHYPGDLDEFVVRVPVDTVVNLVGEITSTASLGAALVATLVDSATGAQVRDQWSNPQDPAQTGPFEVAAGTYYLRVVGHYQDDWALPWTGTYRLWLHTFSHGPETAADTIALGDTIQGEAIDVVGDDDIFHFHGTKGQQVNLQLQGLGVSSPGTALSAFLAAPGGGPVALVGGPLSAPALSDHQTLRLELHMTGWYTLTVSVGSYPLELAAFGPYRVALVAANTAPEVAAAGLAPGTIVTTEAIDSLGDWDEFLVTGAPGDGLTVTASTTGPCCEYPSVLVFDPATGDTLGTAVLQGTQTVGPFTVPAGGRVTIAVFERPNAFFRECYDATCGDVYRYVGPYQLELQAVTPGRP